MVDNPRSSSDAGANNFSSFVMELQKIWINEKQSKNLLQINENLINRITSLIDQKEEEIKSRGSSKKEAELELIELDIERVKFLLKDYFRIRMKKV